MLRTSTPTVLGPGFAGLSQDFPMLRRSSSLESVLSVSSSDESASPESEIDCEEEEVENMLIPPSSVTTTLRISLYRTAAYERIASLAYTVAQIPATTYTAGTCCGAALGATLANAASLICKPWQIVRDWWDPLRRAPSPDPVKLARALGRRRRPMTPDQSTFSLVATAIPQTHAPVPALTIFQNVVSTTGQRRFFLRPKSLQNARRWRDVASTTTSFMTPPTPSLTRIDLHVQYTRLALGALHLFRQYFKYDVPSAETDIESICNNPVLEEAEEGWIPSPVQQPTLVVHRMSWQGEKEQVLGALKAASLTTLTNLSIDHGSIAMSDLVAILGTWQSLEHLEVRDVVPDEWTGAQRFPAQHDGELQHNLTSLTLTSHGRLDLLIQEVKFLRLSSLTLRLHGAANQSNFEGLLSKAFPCTVVRNMPRTFTLRGQLTRSEKLDLKAALGRLLVEVAFDYGHI